MPKVLDLARFLLLMMGFFSLFGMMGCAGDAKEEMIGSVETLYNQGADELEHGKASKAVNAFEELERQHPYSGWATRAQMMTVFAHYKKGDYDEAITAADRFIRLHAGHKDLPYVYYMRAMSHYNQISDVRRDQSQTQAALEGFQELVKRYPETEYAQDARLKITLCLDHLAGQEMLVGRFYEEQKRYQAAINRFRYVVEHYQTSTHTPEALFRLTECYLAMGITDEAQSAAAVLGANFPASRWYKDAYTLMTDNNLKPAMGAEKSWLRQVFKGVKDVF